MRVCVCSPSLSTMRTHTHTYTRHVVYTKEWHFGKKVFVCFFITHSSLHCYDAVVNECAVAAFERTELIVDSAPVVGRAPMRQRCTPKFWSEFSLETRRVTYPAPHGFHIISETTTVNFYGFLPGKGRRDVAMAKKPRRAVGCTRSTAHTGRTRNLLRWVMKI